MIFSDSFVILFGFFLGSSRNEERKKNLLHDARVFLEYISYFVVNMSSNRDNCRSRKNNDHRYTTSAGGEQSFCQAHADEHRTGLLQQRDKLEQDCSKLREDLKEDHIINNLSTLIDQWEQNSIQRIQIAAEQARNDIKDLVKNKMKESMMMIKQLTDSFDNSRSNTHFAEIDIDEWTKQIQQLKEDLRISFGIELVQKDDSPVINLISIKNNKKTNDTIVPTSVVSKISTRKDSGKTDKTAIHNSADELVEKNVSLSLQSSSYLVYVFGVDHSSNKDIEKLFNQLVILNPMDKNGPMNGRCENETSQMEQFLEENFGFANIPGKYIVQGVKDFQIRKSIETMAPTAVISFPSKSKSYFSMKVEEIIKWEQSYKVYAAKFIEKVGGLEFLKHALQGKTECGEEAFRMKFVIRISTCPILMEFDGKPIRRELQDDWPNRIKLVSVTGIDFAGRKHDLGDILHYVSNWKEIYEIDSSGDKPALANERDFKRRKSRPDGKLEQDRLLGDLMHMVKLRLQACDNEGVKIVVETGIGLGVFAGREIGIDSIVQRTSALAIRTVLEQNGPNYKHIRAVIFALPCMDLRQIDNTILSQFAHEFEDPLYKGRIPVLLADQDMHRLTVAIAKAGWTVSQLNPADSHGVFGKYWQNRGPAVEEKLALTTLGLLVQHHHINPNVLNSSNYRFI